MKNKKALISNIILGVIVILIAASIIPIISQQVGLAISESCNSTNQTNLTIKVANTGVTNSFGGGGAEHFGGYTGEVSYKSFTEKVGEYSFIQTNSSALGCITPGSSAATLLGLIPGLFAVAVALVFISMVFSSLRNSGIV